MNDFFKVVPKEIIPTDLEGEYPKTRDELSGIISLTYTLCMQ